MMNGFTGNRAPGASEQSGRREVVLTWHTSRAMLPLVGRIAADAVRHHERLARLEPERDRLDQKRRTLSWPERARRYQLQDEIAAAAQDLREALAELESLGVVLLDASGLVGFPTIVNDRRAYFSWQPGEEDLVYWNYAEELTRHPVPGFWKKAPRERSGKGKSRPHK